jgi:hypothetical protein
MGRADAGGIYEECTNDGVVSSREYSFRLQCRPRFGGRFEVDALKNGSGETGYVRVARSPSLEAQQFTIDVTFRPDGPGLGLTQNTGGAVIVAKPREGITGNFIYSWSLSWSPTTNRVLASVSNNGNSVGVTLESNSLVFTGQTVRATFTFDGQTVRLYLNGCLDSELSTTFSEVYYGSNDVLIGAANYGVGFLRRFDGIIDELTIWNEALDAAQIDDLNPAGAGGSLVGWWGFDADSLTDLSGNANDGVAVGNVPFAAPPTFSCAADLNGDGIINLVDLSILLSQFGQSSCLDTNDDGVMDLIDLSIILNAFGNDCP